MIPDFIPDFRDVQSFEEIQSRFVKSARSIMFAYDLVVDRFSERRIRITALELYLHCAIWKDPNTDMDCEQLNSGTWYVRRKGLAARSRIDITAGCKSENIYCGLLVRGIDGTDGPGKALIKIVRGNTQIPGHQGKWAPEDSPIIEQISESKIVSGPLRLVPRTETFGGKYSLSPRKNLRYPEPPWNSDLRIVVD